MIDLRNTWCKYSKDAADKLKSFSEFGFVKWNIPKSNKNYIIIEGDYSWGSQADLLLAYFKDYRQIEFINGEFQEVKEEVPEDNKSIFGIPNNASINNEEVEDSFNKFGFETPEFEGEILKEINETFIGYVIDKDNIIGAITWNRSGELDESIIDDDIYNNEYINYSLTPIKKELWNDQSIVNKLIINKYGEVRIVQSVSGGKVSTHCSNLYPDAIRVQGWRRATKEEILKLIKD